MTNKERYKQAFSALHASDDFALEAKKVKKTIRHLRFKPVLAFVTACVVLLGCTTVAYAADIGGIRRSIQLWIHGRQMKTEIEFDGAGNYSLNYVDEEGNTQHREGGAVEIIEDGTEKPASEETLLAHLTEPVVQYKPEDRTVWVYWYDQVEEITDKFEEGVCYVKLEHEGEYRYMTIKYQGSYASSSHGFTSPDEFD